MQREDIGVMIESETVRRLDVMSSAEYVFPDRAAAWNWWAIAVAIGVSAVLVALCMTGVIQ